MIEFKNTKFNLIFILIILSYYNTYGQDVHFSQRLSSDRDKNPAFLNSFDGNWQFASVHRQQWQVIGVPYTTSSILFTHNFYTPIRALEVFGGLQYTNDKSGSANLLINRMALNLGATYQTDMGRFTLATSNNIYNKNFNQKGLTFPSQYDRNRGGFNENLASGENFAGESINYYQLNIGLR